MLLIAFVWMTAGSIAYSVLINTPESWSYPVYIAFQLGLVFDVICLVKITTDRSLDRLLLPLALVTALTAALPYSIGVPGLLFGYDGNLNYASTVGMLHAGWNPTTFSSYFSLQGVIPWPILDALSSSLYFLGNTSLVWVIRFLPLFLSLFALLALYSVVKLLFGRRVAVFAVLAIGTSFLWISVNDVYVRNSMGNALFWPFILTLFQTDRRRDSRVLGLSFLLGFTIVLSHSLTSLLLLVVLVFLILEKVSRWILRKAKIGLPQANHDPGTRLKGTASGSILMVMTILTLMVLAYWTYIFNGPLQAFGRLVEELASGYQVSRQISLPRVLSAQTYISVAGTFGFLALAIVQVLFRTVRDPKFSSSKSKYGLLGAAIFTAGESSTFFHSLYLDTLRFTAFTWPFLIPASLHESERSSTGISKLAVVTLVLFVAFNLAIIPPANIDHKVEPDYASGQYRLFLYPSEYSAIGFLPAIASVAGDQAVWHLVSSFRPDSIASVNLEVFNGNLSALKGFNYLVVRAEDYKLVFSALSKAPATRLSNETYTAFLTDPGLQLVYSDQRVVVFWVSPGLRS